MPKQGPSSQLPPPPSSSQSSSSSSMYLPDACGKKFCSVNENDSKASRNRVFRHIDQSILGSLVLNSIIAITMMKINVILHVYIYTLHSFVHENKLSQWISMRFEKYQNLNKSEHNECNSCEGERGRKCDMKCLEKYDLRNMIREILGEIVQPQWKRIQSVQFQWRWETEKRLAFFPKDRSTTSDNILIRLER